jgi:hypothetical protein
MTMLLKRLSCWLLTLSAVLAASSAGAVEPWQMPESPWSWLPSDNRWQPLGPVGFEHDGEPFAPVDISEYGGRDNTTQGVFFTYEKLNWMIQRPEARPLGFPGQVQVSGDGQSFYLQSNGRDLSVASSPFTWGNRFDLGYWDGDTGWSASILDLDDQLQHRQDTGVAVNFFDPGINIVRPSGGPVFNIPILGAFIDVAGAGGAGADGIDDDIDGDGVAGRFIDTDMDGIGDQLAGADLVDYDDLVTIPTQFDELVSISHAETAGVELMKMYRFRPFHNGGLFEFSMGARYMEFNDKFRVNARGGFRNQFANLGTAPDNAGNLVPIQVRSFWDSQVDNNLIGPQITGRYSNRRGHWNFVAEGRIFAAYNFQNVKLRGQLGGNIPNGVVQDPGGTVMGLVQNMPANLDNSNFEHFARFEEFAPGGELRIESTYAISKAVALKVGWTGIYSVGTARAANMVVYQVPHLGISNDNHESWLTHGVNFGVEWNR